MLGIIVWKYSLFGLSCGLEIVAPLSAYITDTVQTDLNLYSGGAIRGSSPFQVRTHTYP